MNSVMMAPALYCLDIMLLTLGALIGALVARRCCSLKLPHRLSLCRCTEAAL